MFRAGWNPTLSFLPYHNESRLRQRRWVQGAFGEKDTIRQYESLQQREVCTLLRGLLETPKDFAKHLSRCATLMSALVSR